jgi:hypothetical protein
LLIGQTLEQDRCLLQQFLQCSFHQRHEFMFLHERLQLGKDRLIEGLHEEILTVSRKEVPTLNY